MKARPLARVSALLVTLAATTLLSAPADASSLAPVRSLHVVSQIDHAAKVAWSAPDTTRTVSSYRVVVDGHLTSLAASARSATVSGLTNGTAVDVRVRPVYRSGDWGEVRIVSAMGATKPSTPVAPTLSATDSPDKATKVVTITWPSVTANGPSPLHYRVRRATAAGARVVCDWQRSRTCTDVVPNNGATVTWSVRARNAESYEARAEGHRTDYASGYGAGRSLSATPAPATIAAAKGAAVPPGTMGCSGTCWYVVGQASHFSASATCGVHDASNGALIGSTWTQADGSKQSTTWVGPGFSFYLSCTNGAHSATYTW